MNKKQKTAVIAGTFDPITKGHVNIILRSLSLFDKIYIAVGENINKKTMFPLAQRLDMIKKSPAKIPETKDRIIIESYNILLMDYCKKRNIDYVVRGLRNGVDFEYENKICKVNKLINPNVETVFLLSDSEQEYISSSFVREILAFKGNVSQFMPEDININDYIFPTKQNQKND